MYLMKKKIILNNQTMVKRKKYFLDKVKFLVILGLLTVLACSDGSDQGDSDNIDSKSITTC